MFYDEVYIRHTGWMDRRRTRDETHVISGRRPLPKNVSTDPIVEGATRPGIRLASPGEVESFPHLSAEEAFRELLAGNQRFAANQLTSLMRDLNILRQHNVDKQEPIAAVLACADSRVPVELLFDQAIGRVFVTRVAGNIATPEIVASLEYGIAILGVKALLVLGHTGCGALGAAMKADTVPGQISSLYKHLQPAVEQSGGDVGKAIANNARLQAEFLRKSSTVIGDALKAGNLRVESGVYDLATGIVSLN
jgi:carbonic anhydrase